MRPIEKVLARFPDARQSGKGYSACCPVHEDRSPSLSIAEGDDGRALIHCHAGCSPQAVVRELGLVMADLMPERPDGNGAGVRGHQQGNGFPSADAAIRNLERQRGPRSKEWQYLDDAGVHVGSVIRWDIPGGKTIRPVSRRDGQWRSEGMQSPRPLYRLPEVKAADRIVVTEGEKAADAAVSLGYSATTSSQGSQSAKQTDWSRLAGKEVVILPDNDEAGRKYSADVAEILLELDPPATVRIVNLPDLPDGGDIADLVEAAGVAGLADLKSRVDVLIVDAPLVARAEAPSARQEDDKPKIWLATAERPRVTDQSLAVLAEDHFERGGMIVRCIPSSRGTTIHIVTVEAVEDALNRRITFATWKEDEEEANGGSEEKQTAPAWLSKTIVGIQTWAFIRPLEGVHHGPFLRADGSIGGIRPGYDAASRCWIDTRDDWTALETPTTRLQVDEAIAILREVIAEFPFESEVSESVWIALILTRLARSAFYGPSPMFTIDATTPGSGKTMLARLAGLIADGRTPGVMSFSESEGEMRKVITSMLMAGATFLIFDNVAGLVKSPTLDRLLTATEWEDRILQGNKIAKVSNTSVPVLTANNAEFHGDTLRRSLFLRLAPLQERPEERTFRIENLDEYVSQHRPRLLIAAMRILQWHVQCGRPQQQVRSMGSFESWSAVVRQAIIHAGLPDPCVNAKVADAGSSAVEAFLACWKAWNKAWAGSARHLVEAIYADHSPAAKALQEASLELVGKAITKDGTPDPQVLGNHLGRIQGRNFANLRIMRSEKRAASGYAWRLEEVTQPAKK